MHAGIMEEYASLVDQVIDEHVDIREVRGYSFDEDQGNLSFADGLLQEMCELRATMADGA